MLERTINPNNGMYSASEDYIHALEVCGAKRQLFISGTMGLDEQGKAPSGIDAQLILIWKNIRCILSEADMSEANIVRVTSYLRSGEYAEKNQNARVKALGERRVPTTAIIVETLQPDWLVELEVIAVD